MAVHVVFDQVRFASDQSGSVPGTGQVGERQIAVMSGLLGAGFTTTQWGNVNSLALTPGDWILTGIFQTILGGTITNIQHALSQFTGNTTTDHVAGDNQGPALGSLLAEAAPIRWRVSTSVATTIFAKSNITGAVLASVVQASIVAERWR